MTQHAYAEDWRPDERGKALTAAQLAVLALLVLGLTDGEIGHRLGCSPRTVQAHTSHIYARLGVSGRVQAVVRALQLGLATK